MRVTTKKMLFRMKKGEEILTEENLKKNESMENESSNPTKNTKRRGYHRN